MFPKKLKSCCLCLVHKRIEHELRAQIAARPAFLDQPHKQATGKVPISMVPVVIKGTLFRQV